MKNSYTMVLQNYIIIEQSYTIMLSSYTVFNLEEMEMRQIVRPEPVEIIQNDQGNKTMPSHVAFTKSRRLIGDTAK